MPIYASVLINSNDRERGGMKKDTNQRKRNKNKICQQIRLERTSKGNEFIQWQKYSLLLLLLIFLLRKKS